MLNELFAGLILHKLTTVLLPTDGAQLEAATRGETYVDEGYGDRGGFFNGYLQYVDAHAPIKVDMESLGIVTSAVSTIVVDADTSVLLYGERPYDVRAIGSVTKLMAIMVFLDTAPDLRRQVILDPKTDLVMGGREYISFYRPIVLKDVLGAAMVGSDNSATQSLVRFADMTEEEFVEKMNEKAQQLGMAKTFFTDPTGIRATNVSTALDLSRLLAAAEKYDVMREFMQKSVYTVYQDGNAVEIHNTNDALASYTGASAYRIIAGKTGYLPEAGYVLASTVEHKGHRVRVVVMGADSKERRSLEMRALAEWTFHVYRWRDQL